MHNQSRNRLAGTVSFHPVLGGAVMAHREHPPCIEACIRCALECEHCETACLGEPDMKMMAECIRLDRDCATVCWLAAAFMGRRSEFDADLCRLCATLCDACGAECAKHKVDHCLKCAESCRACAEACRTMAAA